MQKFFLSLVLIALCVSGCSKGEKFSLKKEEKKWLEEFFTDILFENGGAYTLWGTKPITTIPVYLFSDEENNRCYEELLEKKQENVLFIRYTLQENWKKWEKIQDRFKLNKYYLLLRKNPKEPKAPRLFFVNILATTSIIEDHYKLFRKELGYDFNSFQVIKEIKNKDSQFWNDALDNPILLGILFGYGKENALCFFRKHVQESPLIKDLEALPSDQHLPGSTSLDHFPIPVFASFSINDPMIKKYCKEREMIKKHYVGKDLVTVTLNKLEE